MSMPARPRETVEFPREYKIRPMVFPKNAKHMVLRAPRESQMKPLNALPRDVPNVAYAATDALNEPGEVPSGASSDAMVLIKTMGTATLAEEHTYAKKTVTFSLFR